MAGTNRTQSSLSGGPPLILCRPQLGENVGLAARAMLNCGLTELRLVAPRDGWPSERARAAASGADAVLADARVFSSLEAALGDLTHVFAATARPRDRVKPVVTPREAGLRLRALVAGGQRPGLLVGPEREGLTNDELSLCDTLVTADLNPAFASLNLSQAVLLLGYEWRAAGDGAPPERLGGGDEPAPKAELLAFLARLEAELDLCAREEATRPHPVTKHHVRDLLQRARPTSRELQALHGVVSHLVGRRRTPPGR